MWPPDKANGFVIRQPRSRRGACPPARLILRRVKQGHRGSGREGRPSNLETRQKTRGFEQHAVVVTEKHPVTCRAPKKDAARWNTLRRCSGVLTRAPRSLRNETAYGKRISTRRFCGSRTPCGVGTRRSLKLRPATDMSLRATPSAARRVATAFARRSESRWL